MTSLSSELKTLMTAEISNFESAVKDYLSQKISESQFQRIRLQHGVYGQRQDGVQMIRIKLPFGGVSAEQLEVLADVCEKYSKGIAHITTRQDIQIHFVKVARVPELMRDLAKVGITTREACGNTVRNVTACPYAGVSPTEVFDVTPYSLAMAHHLLRNPICQNLGRKFKIAFEGCADEDHARCRIHDLAFVAKIQDGQRGFQVQTGGGLGATPRIGDTFYEFVPEAEMIPFAEAILRVFDRYGERKIRSKARMKFVVKKFGFEKFKELVEAERKLVRVDPSWNAFLKGASKPWESAPTKPVGKTAAVTEDFKAWKQTNVTPQRQKGFAIVELRLPLGDMLPSQMRSLADILRRYAGGALRTSIEQNLVLRWVFEQDLPALYQELKAIKMAEADAETVYDVMACPGTDTCRLGIAGSRPLATVLEKELKAANGSVSELAKDLRVRISGCPNSCGQHHIGNIGFHGAALPQSGHTVPAFQLMLGGGVQGHETTVGEIIMKVPAKNVPQATVRMIEHYGKNRKGGQDFNGFYKSFGKENVRALLKDLSEVPSFESNPEFYKDWGEEAEFGLQQGVVGECAGAPMADVVPQIAEADVPLQQARALVIHGEWQAAQAKALEALGKAADAVLYQKMIQSFRPIESLHLLENHFGQDAAMSSIVGVYYRVSDLCREATAETVEKLLIEAESVLALCRKKLGA